VFYGNGIYAINAINAINVMTKNSDVCINT